jgi:hypothetical protein
MANRLGPIDIVCDAPAYGIVHACRELGFEMPEDVRWCQVSHLPMHQRPRPALANPALGSNPPSSAVCHCGQALPRMDMYTFQLLSGKELSYWISQCPRCHSIFWQIV